VPGESLTGPWQIERAVPFTAEPQLFAAPLVATRDGGWVLLGFTNREQEGVYEFDIGDPIPVRLNRSGAVAGVQPVG
jgi:beta-fructofuranosidase